MGWRMWYPGVPVVAFSAAVVAAAMDLPLREVTAVVFLTIGPGAAITWLVGVRDRAAWFALVVPISLSIDVLVTTALLYLNVWSPELSVMLITGITVVAIALVPFERVARVALIGIALLPGLVLLAPELSPEPSSHQTPANGDAVAWSDHRDSG